MTSTGAGRLREWLAIYLKGVFMGAADTIPGVSGGTIALITGIYERLVTAVAALDVSLGWAGLNVVSREGRDAFVNELVDRDVPFLLVLGAGIGTAIVGLSRIMLAALESYPAEMYALFFGLIGASAIVLYAEVSLESVRSVLLAVVGFAVAFVVTGASGDGAGSTNLFVVFGAGMVTSSAMLLPGISGAALLVILGQYETMIAALHGFIDALLGGTGGLVQTGTVVVVFVSGLFVGLLTISHVAAWALREYRRETVTMLVSLMVGALRAPAREIAATTAVWTPVHAVTIAVAMLAGAALVLGLDHFTDDLEYV